MAQLAVGDVFDDRYRIDHPIARGGMSTVYRCVDLRLGRAVAAKVLDEKYLSDPVFRQRFRREARAMAQLTHPNLVNVYDFGSDGEHLFLVMELITGGTLRELIAERGPMPPHAAAAVMRSVLTGLSVAHTAGLVHRDIKPDNVLISADHRVKLADFGLVRAVNAATATNAQIVGTVAYLSPEQVDGSEITTASDVYSAGIVLFELLTGTTPFEGESPLAHAYQRLDEVVPAPSSRIAGVPPLIDALVATATSPDPADRFADAGEFLAALDDVASELALPAFTVPVPTNSAANRAAAVPTDITDLMGPATGIIDNSRVEETAVLGTETRMDTPRVLPTEPPAIPIAPVAGPAAIPEVVDHSPQLPAQTEPDAPAPVSNRSRVGLIVWLTVVVIITIAVALGAWWFGSGRYGEIPQVLGMDRMQAVSTVEQAGFAAATRIVYSDDIPADSIAGTEPSEGERLVRGNEVTVLVSQGRPTIPAAQGMDILEFQQVASERTLKISTGDPIYSSDVDEGRIAKTDPAAGEAVPIGSTVTVHMSRGPEPVQVPDVVGLSLPEAEAKLAALDLTVSKVEREYRAGAKVDEVLGVTPDVGVTVNRGGEVTLHVSSALSVPDVSGMDLDAATAALEQAGFSVDGTRRTNSEVRSSPSAVIGTSPAAGTTVKPDDATIDIILPGRVTVPDVTGQTVRDARAILLASGLKVNATERDDARVVSRQRPAAGDDARVDSTVRVTY
ncbi:Stk1 family PASTA domain-containing Ser/Thr kinase [Corynebacterium atrinae]|uniref:Stk1 family PASTA domain-containing Ser/Thr kinase n=1 Tax=Corynebacterium atrinae TaxID=1336740 RepID=UPI0025B585C0|nr:Stk1 family PASTA domain-containing Ser/Thr kinase [Corynebacterium atrinae]